MKKLVVILLLLPVLFVLVFVFGRMKWKFSQPPRSTPPEQVVTNAAVETTPTPAVRNNNELLGLTILRGYAETNLPPENDLTLMARLMENSLLLLKTAANRPLSANEDWADLFRGKNGAREAFLPAQHVALNDKGQLIDRWQTPLFFHALGGGRYEIRSAGPDQQMWTADDLQRNSNGTFLREKKGGSESGR